MPDSDSAYLRGKEVTKLIMANQIKNSSNKGFSLVEIIVAIAIFIVVKILNSAKDKMIKQEEKKEEKPKWSTQEQLLAEIRDLLKKKA